MKNNRLIIGSIFLLFLILGSWQINHARVSLRTFPIKGDNWGYYTQARQVLSGNFTAVHSKPGLVYFEALLIKIFDAHNKNPYAEKNNIYAILKFANVVIGSLTAILVYLIALLVFRRKTIAFLTIIILAIYRFPLFEAERLLTEPLYTFLSTLSIFFILRTFKYFLLRDKLLAGLSLGLALITRGEIKSFIPLIFLWSLIAHIDIPSWRKGWRNLDIKKWKRIFSSYLLILSFVVLLILPLTVRNYIITKEFIPINTDDGGEALWIGNCFSRATRNFTGLNGKELLDSLERSPLLKQQFTNVWEKHHGYTTKKGSNLYFKYAIENIRSDSKDFFLRCLVKSRIMWTLYNQKMQRPVFYIRLPFGKNKIFRFNVRPLGGSRIVPVIFIGMFIALFLIPNKESYLLLLYIWNDVFIHVISRARGGRDLTPYISLATIFAAFAIYILLKGFWKGLKGLIHNRGLATIQVDRSKRRGLIFIFLLAIAGSIFSYKFRNEISIVSDHKRPYAFASVRKISSDLVYISGSTEPGSLIVLEDNGKEGEKDFVLRDDGSFHEFFHFPPGEHKLVLTFYDKSYNFRKIERTITILQPKQKREKIASLSNEVFCLNGNLSEKEKRIIKGATYTYTREDEEFFPRAAPDEGGNKGWIATGGDGSGFGDLTDSLNEIYHDETRVALGFQRLSDKPLLEISFDLKRKFYITEITLIQDVLAKEYGFRKIFIQIPDNDNLAIANWHTVSVLKGTQSTQKVKIKGINRISRFVKIVLCSPSAEGTQDLYDIKIFGKKIL